ncbi:MAG: sigma-70 family RNA polymerase sigma factor [Actinomycetota bacterium]|nr:sigma-70 family RNA polymerase sigma factor [Actinomycetota bacterium]
MSPDPAEAAEEAAVIYRAQGGDVAAFTDLYHRHSRWVLGVALRLVDNPGEAEEVTQDTFVQVWKSLPRFRGESQLRTWIHRICVNRCYRSNARRAAHRSEELPDDLVSADPDPGTVAVLRGQMADLQQALATLPQGLRAALVLREFGGLAYEEVADALGITLTAARSRIHRARLQVVSQLDAPPTPIGAGSPTAEPVKEASA